MTRLLTLALAATLVLVACAGETGPDDAGQGDAGRAPPGPQVELDALPYARLSQYGFFRAELRTLTPVDALVPFEPVSPLWSDHAAKQRLLYVPKGEQLGFAAEGDWTFPTGTVAIKSFFFPADMRDPDGPFDPIETRLLVRGAEGFEAYVYLWNEQRTDAELLLPGRRVSVEYIDEDGEPVIKPMLNSDGDVARHLRHGHHMLEHGELIRVDPFSFTRPGAPFTGFEYGSQLLYALAERVGGLAGVAVLAGLLIAVTYALLAKFLLTRGVDPLLACVVTALAIALGVNHWTARPHLFSFVAVMVLMSLLEGDPRRRLPLLACLVLFGIWANLHGGFVYGWILIGLYLAGSLGELVWGDDKVAWRDRVRYYGAMLATSVPVTLINPHGLELHRHLIGFFSKPFIRDNTAEFASPNFHEGDGKAFLAILLLGLVSLVVHRRRPTLPRLLVICVGVAFALIAHRNIPLFGLTALPVLALHLDDLWRHLPDPGGVRGRFESTAGNTVTLAWTLPVGALLAVLLMTGGKLGPLQLIRGGFDSTVFPVDAVAHARRQQMEGRVFSEFTWGGYLVYAWPEQKIFIDGGTDFFGEELFREFSKIKQMAPGWRDLLNKWDISLMLLQRQSTLAHEIARDPRWILQYCDSLATLFHRSPAILPVTAARADSAEHVLDTCGSR